MENIRKLIEDVSIDDLKKNFKSPFFLSGILLAILFWFVDPIIDSLLIYETSVKENFLNPSSHEIYERTVFSFLILFYSYIIALVFETNKKSKNELSRFSNILEKIFSSSFDIIFVKDRNLRIILCNDAFANSLGKTRDDVYGKTDIEIGLDPNLVFGDKEKVLQNYLEADKEVLKGKTIQTNCTPFLIQNKFRFFKTIKTPLLNSSGEIIGLLGIACDITDRLHSEERYRNLVEATTNIVWTTDESGGFNIRQESWEGYTGQTWEEYKGFGWTKMIHPDDISQLLETWNKACEEKTFYESSGRIWNKSHQAWRKFEVKATPIIEPDGCLREWVGIINDIEEQKQAELLHKESEEKFHTIFETIDVGIVMRDMSGSIIELNQGFLNIIGYTEEEARSLTFWDITPTEYKNNEKEQLYSLRKTGKFGPYEKEYIHKQGHRIPVLLSGIVTNDVSGEKRIWSIVQNISEVKQMENTIRESHERFRTSFKNAPIGMALVSLEHSIIEANQAFCDMLGYSIDEIAGVYFKDITHHDDVEKSIKQHNQLIANEIDNYSFEKRYIHKDGLEVWGSLSVSLVKDDNNSPLYAIAQIQDITESKEASELLSYQANHDALTGLVNRREFERRTERLLKTIHKEKEGQHALCFMDLDQFKVVNDNCGHTAGDEMLRQISSILQGVVRHRDTLARLGGDEFGVLMEYCSLDDAHRVATSLQKAIQDYIFSWEGHSFKVGVSIGLVPIIETIPSLNELLKEADAACYMAKDKGRNRIHVYHAGDSEIAKRHGEMQWVERLYRALDNDRFCLYAQSIMPLKKNEKAHYELLIRMLDDNGDIVPPNAFLPAAERYNIISRLDTWVIEKTFQLLSENQNFLSKIKFCSINLSGSSLSDSAILDFIISQLKKYNINADKICFEITETAAILNMNNATKFISTLKKLGCCFALDDFGIGLSSFAYLKNLPVDYLKIDGMFVKDIVDDPIDHAMVKSINEIGQVMGMKTIAEFVENDVIQGMLKEIGVNYAQGYGIEKPKPFEELLKQTDNVFRLNK